MLQIFTFLCTSLVDCAWLEEYPFSMSKNSRLTSWDSIFLGNKLPYSRYPDETVHHARRLLIQSFQGRNLISEAESQIPTPEKEIDSDEDYCESTVMIDQLNKSCEALDVSTIKVSKFSSKRKLHYMQTKVKKLSKCVATKAAAVIGVDNISNPSKTKDMTCPDCISMMQKLLNKFTNASLKEKIQILTLVPDSWTIQQTRIYFNTTEHLVKKARKLKATGGVLSMPCDKKGAKLSSETVEKIIAFYYNDDNCRICPGKKDCISVASENGRVFKQKRLILYNLK
ncbi:hypothetical protein AVEN_244878-1 [Araneus ventricosus]|uniref:HMA domain-containing protein n=1 Tax=Araneus ventricosus TaxID=182803 RepID=A0A4Y2KZM7_ARAVE|nr:hypothetical protein AVEN_244878-1 [Araneus ventricosus]